MQSGASPHRATSGVDFVVVAQIEQHVQFGRLVSGGICL